MACLVMYNSEHNRHCPPISPRISFSNDFVETQHILQQERSSRQASASTDFEFSSVTNYSMMSADELLFKGRLLPFRGSSASGSGNNQMQRTIRDELLVNDDDDGGGEHQVAQRPPRSSTKWKGLLGLKRGHIGSKKADKGNEIGSGERVGDSRKAGFVHEEVHVSKTEQEMLSGGGSSCRDMDIDL